MTEEKDMKPLCRIIEGILFAEENPISPNRLLELFEEDERPDRKVLKEALEQLQADYAERGIELKELASGYQFQVRADLSKWVSKLWEERAPRYSRALLETLVLIAYRQPITRGEIEEVRGVAVSSNIVRTLMEREWVKVVGHKEVPGRPALLATTKDFLDYFGLQRLQDLPPLSEIQDLDKVGEMLEKQLDLKPEDEAAVDANEKEAPQEENELMADVQDDEILSKDIVEADEAEIISAHTDQVDEDHSDEHFTETKSVVLTDED